MPDKDKNLDNYDPPEKKSLKITSKSKKYNPSNKIQEIYRNLYPQFTQNFVFGKRLYPQFVQNLNPRGSKGFLTSEVGETYG